MNRPLMIGTITKFLENAPEAVRGALIEEILGYVDNRNLEFIIDNLDDALDDAHQNQAEGGHSEPEENCEGCRGK